MMKIPGNGSRPLSLIYKNKTPYLNAVIAEIHRHASILNINFWRVIPEGEKQTQIEGYSLDPGASVTAQLSLLHTDDSIYHNPENFDPERFLEHKNLAQCLIPFGVGKRACTGEALARAELYLIIGNLLLRYQIEPSGKLETNIDSAPFCFAKKPKDYRMKFRKIIN